MSSKGRLFAQLGPFGPSGSVYDHVVAPMLRNVAQPAIVAGSGSLGAAFSALAHLDGMPPLTVVCPESTRAEVLDFILRQPVKLLRSPASSGLLGTHDIAMAEQWAEGARVIHTPRRRASMTLALRDTVGAALAVSLGGLREHEAPHPQGLFMPVGSGALIEGVMLAVAKANLDVTAFGSVAVVPNTRQDGVASLESAPPLDFVQMTVVDDAQAERSQMDLARREGLVVGLGSAGALYAAQNALDEGRVASAIVLVVDGRGPWDWDQG
ncbi:MAG: pyridoxal-phosphate dependent enzyme [Deltaproteobacteria bacterium]|nr:pyridoxal-phosphate dependent enzyme [Deltaproteobacteria bacterium]